MRDFKYDPGAGDDRTVYTPMSGTRAMTATIHRIVKVKPDRGVVRLRVDTDFGPCFLRESRSDHGPMYRPDGPGWQSIGWFYSIEEAVAWCKPPRHPRTRGAT